ncbi:MAG: ribokinase [Cyanobacteria bacterium P01_A01_bin.135]
MTILVFGSINMDFVAQVPRLPRPGETLTGDRFSTVPGGKGANQAVAVARLEEPCEMVGRVGADSFGGLLLQHLTDAGVGCGQVYADTDLSSGAAMIEVSAGLSGSGDQPGDNHIVVIPGANGAVGEADVARLSALLPQASWLLLQLEVPLPAVLAAAQAAAAAGVKVMLDPAPARSLPDELYRVVDVITPNQTEASILTGASVNNLDEATRAADWLQQRGVAVVAITLGAQGVLYRSAAETAAVPAFPVQAVDTVAAGDAFNGALAVALSRQQPFAEAVRYGAAAAAIAVTRAGAQDAVPNRAEVESFLSRYKPRPSLDRNL